MTEPTREQLLDPAFWEAHAPKGAQARIDNDWHTWDAGGMEYVWNGAEWLSEGADSWPLCSYTDDSVMYEVVVPRPTPSFTDEKGDTYVMRADEAPSPRSGYPLPPVGTSNVNSSLHVTGISPQVDIWEVIAHRDNEAVVYAPACDANGTDQAEVYLLTADEFVSEALVRLKDAMAEALVRMEVRYTDGQFELFPGPVVDDLLARFDIAPKQT